MITLVISLNDGTCAVYRLNPDGNFDWRNAENIGVLGVQVFGPEMTVQEDDQVVSDADA